MHSIVLLGLWNRPLQDEVEALKRERDAGNLRLNGKADFLYDVLIDSLEQSALTDAPVASRDLLPPSYIICPITQEVMTDPVMTFEVSGRGGPSVVGSALHSYVSSQSK